MNRVWLGVDGFAGLFDPYDHLEIDIWAYENLAYDEADMFWFLGEPMDGSVEACKFFV